MSMASGGDDSRSECSLAWPSDTWSDDGEGSLDVCCPGLESDDDWEAWCFRDAECDLGDGLEAAVFTSRPSGRVGKCRLQRLSARDLAKEIRKATAVRAQVEGRRERVCRDLYRGFTREGAIARLAMRRPQKMTGFESMRGCFFEKFRAQLCSELLNLNLGGLTACVGAAAGSVNRMRVDRAPLSGEVQQRFLAAYSQQPDALIPTYHGTAPTAFESIFARGLLVPDPEHNGVRVVNGQAHGRGVYTAGLGHAVLAQGYSSRHANLEPWTGGDENSVVLDTSEVDGPRRRRHAPAPAPKPKKVQQLMICGVLDSSADVKHVGQMVIVSDESRVAPLFVATLHSEGLTADRRAVRSKKRAQRAAALRTKLAAIAKQQVVPQRDCAQELAAIRQGLERKAAQVARRTAQAEKQRQARSRDHAKAVQRRARAQDRDDKGGRLSAWPAQGQEEGAR